MARRSFIGGSDAQIIRGNDEAALVPFGVKVARPSRRLVR
jgi:hypothetical protein